MITACASGLAVAAGGGSVSDVGTAVSGSKNAVENNFLANKYAVDKLDGKNKELYEKIKHIVGYDETDKLQQRFISCGQDKDCQREVSNEFYIKQQQVGQTLVGLYKSGELTKEDIEHFNSWYADSMLSGIEEGKEDNKYDKGIFTWDVYDASSAGWVPGALTTNPYLAELRAVILLDEWRAAGLSELEIQEKFLKDGVLGSFRSSPDVNSIAHAVRNDGLGVDDAIMMASGIAYGKFTDKANLQQKSKKEIDNLASQYNNKDIHPKDFTISVGGKTLITDKNASVGAPVFKGASDSDVMIYFKQLAGIDAMPTAKTIPGKGTVSSVKITEGPNAGSSLTLRDFSNSTSQTNAKWTIDIQNKNINKGNRVEVKFQ